MHCNLPACLWIFKNEISRFEIGAKCYFIYTVERERDVHRKQGDGEKKKKKTRDRRVEKISRRLLLISKRKLARSNPNQTKDDVKGNGRLEKDE